MTRYRRRWRVARCLLLLVPAAVLLSGCGQSQETPRTLNLAFETSPNKLDPAFVVDVEEGQLCALLFQGLVRFSPAGQLVPDAARSWEVERDGTRFVFRLDPHATFTDGSRLRSSDVVFSFERVLSPSATAPRRWVLSRIRGAGDFTAGDAARVAGLAAPDDSTVTIELDEPFKPFLSMLALPAAMIVPRDAIAAGEGTFSGLPVGSGAWRLQEWQRGDYLSLVPNRHHTRAALHLDEMRIRVIPEPFTRIAEFESGTLDVLEIPSAELRRFLESEQYAPRIQSRAELRVYYIGLNNRDDRFKDVRVRRALNHAVDVDQLIEVLAGGEAVRARGSIPPGLTGFAERAPHGYDPALARRLLAEAGYPEGFEMEIWQRESTEGNRVLEAVQGYLKQSGIDVRLVRREWSAFKEAVSQGRVDAFFLDWFADYPDAENFLFPLFHSSNFGGKGNRAFFRDPEVDQLIEQASRTIDDAACTELYARIDGLVYQQAPWIYLYFPRTFHAVSEKVSDYRLPSLYLGADYSRVRKSD